MDIGPIPVAATSVHETELMLNRAQLVRLGQGSGSLEMSERRPIVTQEREDTSE